MNRVMVIGAVSAGKSTLIKALLQDQQPAAKTQALEFLDWMIDTPGEYSENPLYYRSIMATSFEAGLLMMVQDATRQRNYFPPGFAAGFPIRAIGVVTKADHPEANLNAAVEFLRQSLPEGRIWITSSVRDEGIAELRSWLLQTLSARN